MSSPSLPGMVACTSITVSTPKAPCPQRATDARHHLVEQGSYLSGPVISRLQTARRSPPAHCSTDSADIEGDRARSSTFAVKAPQKKQPASECTAARQLVSWTP
jgi:hypothetical protein